MRRALLGCSVCPMRIGVTSRARVLDPALVVLSFAACEVEAWAVGDVPGPALGRALPLALVFGAPLVWRRAHPLLSCALVMGLLAGFSLAYGSPEGLEVMAPMAFTSYAVSAHSSRARGYAGLAVLAVGYTIYALEDRNIRSGRTGELWAGRVLRRRAARRLADRHLRPQRPRTNSPPGARGRARTGRAGRRRRGTLPPRPRAARHRLAQPQRRRAPGRRRPRAGRQRTRGTLEKIERSSREALVEMRRLLGVLREDDADHERR